MTDLLKRIEQLRHITFIHKNEPSVSHDAYMQGLANGLILALSIIDNDKGEVDFIKFQQPRMMKLVQK